MKVGVVASRRLACFTIALRSSSARIYARGGWAKRMGMGKSDQIGKRGWMGRQRTT